MTTKPKRKTPKPVRAWGGFYNGKLDWFPELSWDAPYIPAIYRSKRAALAKYRDVRRVRIVEDKP